MKFRIIGCIIVLLFIIVLTVIFNGHPDDQAQGQYAPQTQQN